MLKIIKKFITKTELAINDSAPIRSARHRRMRSIIWKIIIAVTTIILAMLFILCLFEIKQIAKLTAGAVKGAQNINHAIAHAKSRDFSQAKDEAELAQANLALSQSSIHKINNSTLSYLPIISSQLTEIEHLITATELVSRGLNQGLGIANDLKTIASGDQFTDYNSFSPEQKQAILNKLYTKTPELNGLQADLELALIELDHLKLHGVLWPVKYRILEVRDKIALGSSLLKEAVPLTQILPVLAGHPAKSTFLIVLQNADELRPTGGFIGTYGILETQNGDISQLHTHDIYHMDMPSRDKISVTPPDPVRLYLNKNWYMRDANWSPNWPTSAKQLEWFYSEENKYLSGKNDINNFRGQFNGVIAINPGLVINLLKLVGPIKIDNQTYTADNFSQVLEFEVEQGYEDSGTAKWQRKEVIGKIVKQLKIRLLNLPSNQWSDVLMTLKQSLEKKDVMFYFSDPGINEIAKNNDWGGEIKHTDKNFVMMVDSNLASLKTDSVISREVQQIIEKDDQGLKATFKITYHHSGKAKDWRTDRYKNYARLYVPKGSRLINFDGATVPVITGEEEGKTVFGSLFYVELNSSKTVTISYYLPKKIEDAFDQGRYDLYWQRQSGSRITSAQVDVIPSSKVKSKNSKVGETTTSQQVISWPVNLTKDQEISLNF